jgi:GNAT superfamily N-acetyltransferase
VQLRVARVGDRAAVRAFLDRLSPSTVQARFLSPARSLAGPVGDAELERLLERNEAEHIVLLAVDGAEVRGIGEFVIEQARHAVLALVVEDAFQGRGVGRSLLRRLEQLALTHGIRSFTGDMAHGNSRAVALLRATGRTLQTRFSYGSLQFKLLLEV